MQKRVLHVIAIVTVLVLVMVNVPNHVSAMPGPVSKPGIAEGAWSTGTEVSINLDANPAPYTWIQLLTDGVKITAPAKICHGFRGGQYKWIADIRQLVKGKWVKVPTTQGWMPNEEGSYMACAQAPAAGTYALFGYYNGPTEYVSQCPYDMSSWTADIWKDHLEVNLSDDVPEDLTASYKMVSPTSLSPYEMDATGTTLTYNDGDMFATFMDSALSPMDTPFTITIEFTLGGCVVTLPVDTSAYEFN